MTSESGCSKLESCFACARLNTSLMSGGFGVRYDVSEFEPFVNSFDHVYATCMERLRENRCVSFVCSESYHVSPSGGPRNGGIPAPHCGCGRKTCFKG